MMLASPVATYIMYARTHIYVYIMLIINKTEHYLIITWSKAIKEASETLYTFPTMQANIVHASAANMHEPQRFYSRLI